MTLLAVVLGVLVIALALRQRAMQRRLRSYAHRMAEATGHPSAGRNNPVHMARRLALTDEAADRLAEHGLICERITGRPCLVAVGWAGRYLLTVYSFGVDVFHETDSARRQLGSYPDIDGAVAAITAHADRPAPVA